MEEDSSGETAKQQRQREAAASENKWMEGEDATEEVAVAVDLSAAPYH